MREDSCKNCLLHRALVAFDSQHMLTALVEDLHDDVALAAHGINGNGAPSQLTQLQKLGGNRYLVRLLLCRFLAKHRAIGAFPSQTPLC